MQNVSIPPTNIGFAITRKFNGAIMSVSNFDTENKHVEWSLSKTKQFLVFSTRDEATECAKIASGDVRAVSLPHMEFVDEINDVGWVLSSYNRYERTIVYYVGFPSFEADRILQIAHFLTTSEKVTRRLKELQKRFPTRAIEVVPVVIKNNGEIDLLSHVFEEIEGFVVEIFDPAGSAYIGMNNTKTYYIHEAKIFEEEEHALSAANVLSKKGPENWFFQVAKARRFGGSIKLI